MGGEAMEPSKVEDMIPLLPYVHCCHAKFMEMDDNCEETSIPYPEIVKMLVDAQVERLPAERVRGRRTGTAAEPSRRSGSTT